MSARKPQILLVSIAVVAVAALGGFAIPPAAQWKSGEIIRNAFKQGRFDEVLRECETAIIHRSDNVEIILLAADAAEQLGDAKQAVDWLNRLPRDFNNFNVLNGWLKKSDLLLSRGQVTDACQILETVVQTAEVKDAATSRLAKLLCGVGLRYPGTRLLRSQLDNQMVDVESLVILAKNGRRLFGKSTLDRWHRLNPDDSLVTGGMLAVAWEARNIADVEWLLNQAGRFDEAIDLHRQQFEFLQTPTAPSMIPISDHAADDPHSIFLAAQAARRAGQVTTAVRLLRSTLQMDPWNVEANYSLAEMLRASDGSVSDQLFELVRSLKKIESLAGAAANELWQAEADSSAVDSSRPLFVSIRQLIEQLSSIGREPEAAGWARHVIANSSDSAWATAIVSSHPLSKASETQYVHPVTLLPHELEAYDQQSSASVRQAAVNVDEFRFQDVAQSIGLNFAYNNGTIFNQPGLKMHQWTGGGVAVVDFDNDTWPDLYFSQGGTLDVGNHISDQLFRNHQGTKYESATSSSGVHETGFGQGVTAGDFNGDGFTDIYVGNVGRNRLLINQGDGTFLAQTIGESTWTTSVAIADVTGDGHPDIYDVNYLGGETVFTQTCDHDGEQRICGPDDFPAEPDVLHCSDGAGGFISRIVADKMTDARGMGLLVGDLTGTGRNLVYVANDESANQLLQFDLSGEVVEESGYMSGVALNDQGQVQGSMGIACSDFDGNGIPDLFVTNYFSESNNLFRQILPGLFTDESLSTQLSVPGFAMLGFGCQFLDANNDGLPDLAVANGHLDDFTHQNKPFRMKPQLFSNRGNGTFTETSPRGDYFNRSLLGRALATLDWNKDGQQDFVVTHLQDTVGLVENRGEQLGTATSLKLIAVEASRDPIGASVQRANSTSWRMAGDGYQCSNEDRVRIVSVGTTDDLSTVTVRWPLASSDQLEVSASGEFAVIQGRLSVYQLPR